MMRYRTYYAVKAAISWLPGRSTRRFAWWLGTRSVFRWTGYWTPCVIREIQP